MQALDNNNKTNSGNNQSQQGNDNKWVINLSKMLLTQGQETLLAKDPNFAIAPNKYQWRLYYSSRINVSKA